MRIAIIGAGITGLACASECEKLGVYADLYERDSTIGWIWPSVSFWPSIFYKETGDIIQYLQKQYGIYLKPIGICRNLKLYSPNQSVSISGELGYFVERGRGSESLESQLYRHLRRTPVYFNSNADYKELSKGYDWVVVATGNENAARELGVWMDKELVRVIGAVVLGSFDNQASSMYLDTSYAGSGYARITPFSRTMAIIGLYPIGEYKYDMEKLFSIFIEKEGLGNLELVYKILPMPFSTGRVKKFQVGNILLAGRAAGLTDRLIGVGAPEDIISGILAARAIINNENYSKPMRNLQQHFDNISSFRDVVNKLNNEDYDKLLAFMNTPGVKQLIYNSKINFTDMAGKVLKHIVK
jgi:digeranylgeranylglycerophospholipid reductase